MNEVAILVWFYEKGQKLPGLLRYFKSWYALNPFSTYETLWLFGSSIVAALYLVLPEKKQDLLHLSTVFTHLWLETIINLLTVFLIFLPVFTLGFMVHRVFFYNMTARELARIELFSNQVKDFEKTLDEITKRIELISMEINIIKSIYVSESEAS